MWQDREALDGLQLSDRSRILDVGCGTGELTRVLAEESDAEIIGVDVERALLETIREAASVQGDARQLPFVNDAFDLVVCQALLVNIPDPIPVIQEFVRVSRDLVAVIEPDNSQVRVKSTVEQESRLAERARATYTAGLRSDVTIGADAEELLIEGGVQNVSTTRYDFERVTTRPYTENDLQSAQLKRKATRMNEHKETLLRGPMTPREFEDFRTKWREMGRLVLEQMSTGEYERSETIPFFVTVGDVP
jgi:SAM-dependent methyltransferase